ncbi:hypothetical protein D9M71_595600 [compost metagenome]
MPRRETQSITPPTLQWLPLTVLAGAGVERLFDTVAVDADMGRDGAVEVIAPHRLAVAKQADSATHPRHCRLQLRLGILDAGDQCLTLIRG